MTKHGSKISSFAKRLAPNWISPRRKMGCAASKPKPNDPPLSPGEDYAAALLQSQSKAAAATKIAAIHRGNAARKQAPGVVMQHPLKPAPAPAPAEAAPAVAAPAEAAPAEAAPAEAGAEMQNPLSSMMNAFVKAFTPRYDAETAPEATAKASAATPAAAPTNGRISRRTPSKTPGTPGGVTPVGVIHLSNI